MPRATVGIAGKNAEFPNRKAWCSQALRNLQIMHLWRFFAAGTRTSSTKAALGTDAYGQLQPRRVCQTTILPSRSLCSKTGPWFWYSITAAQEPKKASPQD